MKSQELERRGFKVVAVANATEALSRIARMVRCAYY
jgi:hypothetical protein